MSFVTQLATVQPYSQPAEKPCLVPLLLAGAEVPLALAPLGEASAWGLTEATASSRLNACSASHSPYGRSVVYRFFICSHAAFARISG